MKIFHSGIEDKVILMYKKLHPNKPFRVLISFGRTGYINSQLMLYCPHLVDGLIMDSGTYTLYQNPRKHRDFITLKGYEAYLKLFAGNVDFYFNFDEDFSTGGFAKNFGNQLYLERADLNPVPVIHNCYKDEIDIYIDRGYELVSIGSGELKFANQDELYRIVNGIYQKGVKVHYLGCVAFEKLAYIPVWSADSTTCNRVSTSGRILWWNPGRDGYNKKDDITLSNRVPKRRVKYHIRDYQFLPELEDYLWSELGLTIDDLYAKGKNRLINRTLVNIHYFVLLEELINQMHKNQGFTFD